MWSHLYYVGLLMMLFVCCHLSNVVFALVCKLSASSCSPNSWARMRMQYRKEGERTPSKNIKRSKDNWITFFVGNGPGSNKDSLMDLFDRRRNSPLSLLTHVWRRILIVCWLIDLKSGRWWSAETLAGFSLCNLEVYIIREMPLRGNNM